MFIVTIAHTQNLSMYCGIGTKQMFRFGTESLCQMLHGLLRRIIKMRKLDDIHLVKTCFVNINQFYAMEFMLCRSLISIWRLKVSPEDFKLSKGADFKAKYSSAVFIKLQTKLRESQRQRGRFETILGRQLEDIFWLQPKNVNYDSL